MACRKAVAVRFKVDTTIAPPGCVCEANPHISNDTWHSNETSHGKPNPDKRCAMLQKQIRPLDVLDHLGGNDNVILCGRLGQVLCDHYFTFKCEHRVGTYGCLAVLQTRLHGRSESSAV